MSWVGELWSFLKMKSRSARRQEPGKEKAKVRGRRGYKCSRNAQQAIVTWHQHNLPFSAPQSYPRFYILDVWENRVSPNSKGESDRTKGTWHSTPCFPWPSVRPHGWVGSAHNTIPARLSGLILQESLLPLRCLTESLPSSHSQSTEECSTSDFNKIMCNKIQKMKT